MYSLIVIVIICLLILGSITVSIWWLWGKGIMGRSILAVLIITLAGFIYVDIYPAESFYKAEFERVVGIPFPTEGQIVFKDTSYPDFFGDYTSCALIDVPAGEYKKLLARAREVKLRVDRADLINTNCWDALMKRIPGEVFEAEASGESVHGEEEFIYWALIKDQNKVAIHYVSW